MSNIIEPGTSGLYAQFWENIIGIREGTEEIYSNRARN